jgi:hypothetical protein
MDRRLRKIERVLAVQQQLHRLAEWRMAGLDRERRELAESEARLVAALNHDDQLQGVFVDAMARRLAAIARDAERVNRAREVQGRRLREEGMKLKMVERMNDRVRRQYREAFARRGFSDLLETLARPDDSRPDDAPPDDASLP